TRREGPRKLGGRLGGRETPCELAFWYRQPTSRSTSKPVQAGGKRGRNTSRKTGRRRGRCAFTSLLAHDTRPAAREPFPLGKGKASTVGNLAEEAVSVSKRRFEPSASQGRRDHPGEEDDGRDSRSDATGVSVSDEGRGLHVRRRRGQRFRLGAGSASPIADVVGFSDSGCGERSPVRRRARF